MVVCMIIDAITSHRKYFAPFLTLSFSNFPTTPPISTALEIESASPITSRDTRRANQKASFGIALAANRRCRKDWNFFRFGQQLGTRHHLPIAQDEKKEFGNFSTIPLN